MTDHIPGPYCVDRDGDISLDYGERWTLAFTITAADCQPEDSSGPTFTPEQIAATKALLASAPDMHAEIVRLREQLRLATVDQANAEAEANELRDQVRILVAEVVATRDICDIGYMVDVRNNRQSFEDARNAWYACQSETDAKVLRPVAAKAKEHQ